MKNENKTLIEAKELFDLSNAPVACIVSTHMKNLMATYGEENVKEIIRILFLMHTTGQTKKRRAEKAI